MSLLSPNEGTAKAASPKAEFVNSGPKTLTPPRRKAFLLSQDDVDESKTLIFGPVGSGKTFLALGPLLCGQKLLLITTDIGDSGHITIKNALRKLGRTDLYANIMVLPLTGWNEVRDFFSGWNKDAQVQAFKPDVAFWDGFAGFQQIDISQYVADMTPARSEGKAISDGREAGLQFEQTDWGMVKNATVRSSEWFFSTKNPDGRPLHKIMSCHETVKAKAKSKPNEPTVYEEAFIPLLQGAGGQLMLGGFDLILRAKAKTKRGDDGEKRIFTYVTAGHENLVAKNRGFDLPGEMDADPVALWNIILKNLDQKPPVDIEKMPSF